MRLGNRSTLYALLRAILLVMLLSSASLAAMTRWCNPAGSNTAPYDTKAKGATTLWTALAATAAGDTVIIANGDWSTYPGMSINYQHCPPSGSSYAAMTVLKAETDWSVRIGEIGIDGGADRSYILVRGIVFSGFAHSVYNWDHCKWIRCGFFATNVANNNMRFFPAYSDYSVYEECIFWGGGRYGICPWHSNNVVVRRCVARLDKFTNGGDGTNWQTFDYHFYDTSNSTIQNSISIDSDREQYYGTTGTAAESGSFWVWPQGNTVKGCISMKTHGTAFWLAGGGPGNVTVTDSIVLGPIAKVDQSGAIYQGAFQGKANGSATLYNVGVYNVAQSAQNALGDDSGTMSTTKALFRTTGAISDSVTAPCYASNISKSGCTNADPLTNGWIYPVRVENPSNIRTAGITLDITKRYGTDVGNAFPGDKAGDGICGLAKDQAEWDTLTADNLWPFPNEDAIKALFSTTVSGVSGSYGFTTGTARDGSPQTLTKYIWEYFGNQIPSDVYQGSTAISAPNNLRILTTN